MMPKLLPDKSGMGVMGVLPAPYMYLILGAYPTPTLAISNIGSKC